MTNNQIILFGDTTPSDIQFILRTSSSLSSTLSSTRSDAQSAPPELERIFDGICEKDAESVRLSNKKIPPEWSIPELIRSVIGDEVTLSEIPIMM